MRAEVKIDYLKPGSNLVHHYKKQTRVEKSWTIQQLGEVAGEIRKEVEQVDDNNVIDVFIIFNF